MAHILVLYSTTDGQTRRIADVIAATLEDFGQTVRVIALGECRAEYLLESQYLILGASIRYGKHKPEVLQFVRDHLVLLQDRRAAFFSVSAVARKAEKRRPENNLYFRKFSRLTGWQPALTGIFAGRICYALYRPLDRFLIRLIMRITKGPTDKNADVEFTDWDEVRAFAEAFHQHIVGAAHGGANSSPEKTV